MLKIKDEKGEKVVFKNDIRVGTVRKFCCGVDFRDDRNDNALFSITKVSYSDYRLLKCIEKILMLDIPNKIFHWNFNYETAKNNVKLQEYQNKLNQI